MNVVIVPEAKSFRFEAPNKVERPTITEPPLDLTASDGTGLKLVSLTARVVVEDPLAFTELHLVFQNPEPRQLEGRFRIGLPSNASISRFAMRIGSQWQEGEVLERQAARRAYEDFLHRRQDPALLEHEAGNEFSARVFPIEANARKEVLVSYSHELIKPGQPYKLPLLGLPTLGDLEIRALVGRSSASAATSSLGGTSSSQQVIEVRKSNWKPDLDFEVVPPASSRQGLRCGNLAVFRVVPELPTEPDELSSLLVLLDTSASRALGYARQRELVEALAVGLARGAGPNTPLAIACFDQSVDLAFEGNAGDFESRGMAVLRQRLALGASDLAGALRWASARDGKRYERVLLVTDGVATLGDVESEKIVEATQALKGAGVKRLDVLAVGGLRDDATLRRLVTAGLDRDGTVCDGDGAPEEIATKLTRATRSGLKVEVPGASWVWPSRLDGVMPGDATLVYADVPESQTVRVMIDSKPLGAEISLEATERPLLERAWVKARIEKLEDSRSRSDDNDVREGLKKQVIELSTKHRVLSPYTALLVLETEADYARFQIDRKALADILSVGPGGLEVLHRSGNSAPPTPTPPASIPNPKPAPTPAPAAKSVSMSRPSTGAAMPVVNAPAPQGRADTREVMLGEGSDGGPPPGAPSAPASFADDVVEASIAPEPEMEVAAAAPAEDLDMVMLDQSERELERLEAELNAAEEAPPAGMRSHARHMSPAPMDVDAPAPMATAPPPQAAAGPDRASASASGSAASSLFGRMANAVSEAVSNVMSTRTGGQTPPPAMRPPAPPPSIPPPAQVPRPPGTYAEPPRPMPVPGSTTTLPPSLQSDQSQVLESWSGPFREVMERVLANKGKEAFDRALSWRESTPGDVLALVALGESAEKLGDEPLAARAYGSLIDLFPSRADLRRFAGERLGRLSSKAALEVAIDTYRKAVESRPDHPSGHRLLGMALLRAGRYAEAYEAIAAGHAKCPWPSKFPGVDRILTEDLGLAAAAWIRAEPAKKADILARLQRAGAKLEDAPSVRFVLVWETDANDVDFHIHDAKGGHAYFREKVLPSGGELYADITQGYGPECFTIRGAPKDRVYPYKLLAHYYRRGPMGYGMGALQIIEHDGQGNFLFEERPYVVMQDGAYVDLGIIPAPLGGKP